MSDEKTMSSMASVSQVFPPRGQVFKNTGLSFFYGAKTGVADLHGSGRFSLLRPEIRKTAGEMSRLLTGEGILQGDVDATNGWKRTTKPERARLALRDAERDTLLVNLSGVRHHRVALCRLWLQDGGGFGGGARVISRDHLKKNRKKRPWDSVQPQVKCKKQVR